MRIGVPREVKNHEYRVALTPAGAHHLTGGRARRARRGRAPGCGSLITDDDFVAAGARILDTADDVWDVAEMVIKVKEPVDVRVPPAARRGQVLFTYLHLAADRPLHRARCSSAAPPRSPTRPCSCPTGRCRCSPR